MVTKKTYELLFLEVIQMADEDVLAISEGQGDQFFITDNTVWDD